MASVRDLIKLFNSGIANDKDAFQRQENIENIAHKVEIPKSSIIGDADSDDDKPRENPFVNKPQTVFASKVVAKAPTVTTIFAKINERKKEYSKPQPVNKGGVICDESSSDDEKQKPKFISKIVPKVAKIIGDNTDTKSKDQPKAAPEVKTKKIVIGDSSSDEDDKDLNKHLNTKQQAKKVVIGDPDDSPITLIAITLIAITKQSKVEPPKEKKPSSDYNDVLARIYADKNVKNQLEIQRKENKLKEYEELKEKGIFGKLKDESDSDGEKDQQPIDNEKLWNVFAHKEVVEKPIMKQTKRKPKKKEEFNLD